MYALMLCGSYSYFLLLKKLTNIFTSFLSARVVEKRFERTHEQLVRLS